MKKNDKSILEHKTRHFQDIELYGDPGIATYDAKVPLFLKITYIMLPIWGIILGYYYWNGSIGWLDRGHWHQLQIAANTTFPEENQNPSKQE